jgi:hypothetical protein
MKKSIIIFIIFLMSGICSAQETTAKKLFINGFNINDFPVKYIELVCWNNQASANWRIIIDTGTTKYAPSDKQTFQDANNKDFEFLSPMQAVNYLDECGWELISSFGGRSEVITQNHYVLKKKVK